MTKADQFALAASLMFDPAEETSELPDSYVAQAVLAGIAAADVICMRALGVYHSGQDHSGAVQLLGKVDRAAAQSLTRLLALKSKAEYSAPSANRADVRTAHREHLRLVERAHAEL